MTSARVRRRFNIKASAAFTFATGPLAIVLALVPSANAATSYYVGPDGTGSDCTHEAPCALSTGAANAAAGDFVILLDGTYANQSLSPVSSGTATDWITFQADVGAVPILDGGGGAVKASGVGSDMSTYVRFVGIVARNWATGFTNQWTGSKTEFTANGNWQYINCIGDGNTRNGFAFNSAKGILMRECISAHNGTSTTSSWSSGFQLYGVQGTAADNVVERNVAFENMDNQKHTDGSGFIVDTQVKGVTFVNNLGFLNGGSCIRLTDSANIAIINNTCYHNGRDSMDTGPDKPAEVYFTDGSKTQGLTFVNNLGIADGSAHDPTVAWYTDMGSITIPASNKNAGTLMDPTGTNPDFRLTSASSALIDKGDAAKAPAVDVGFDPKCITKTKPTDIAVPSWAAYSVDYKYIKSLGGVAKCWKPGTRPAGSGIDIGAYEVNATAAPQGTGGSWPPASGGNRGGGGISGGNAGKSGTGTATGGTSGTGGAVSDATGGKPGSGTGGAPNATGGSSGTPTGGTSGASDGKSQGCACGISGEARDGTILATVLAGILATRLRRRRGT